MLSKNKRATTTLEMVIWIPRLFFLVAVVLSVSILINIFIITDIKTFDTEANIIIQRIIFSKSLNFHDVDESRLHIGTIDLKKFQSGDIANKLENEIFFGQNEKISANVSLKNLDKDLDYKDIFYKKDIYNQNKELVNLGLSDDPGGVKSLTKQVYVLIRDENSIEKGLLNIEVIIPNS